MSSSLALEPAMDES